MNGCGFLGCQGDHAGAFLLDNSPATLSASTVTGCWGRSIVLFSSPTTLSQCTIASNAGTAIDAAATDLFLTRTITWGNCPGGEIRVDAASTATLECCALPPDEIQGEGETVRIGEQVNTDPLLCDPSDCEDAPTTSGDFTLHSASPRTAAGSPRGEQIGATVSDAIALPSGGRPGRLRFGARPEPAHSAAKQPLLSLHPSLLGERQLVAEMHLGQHLLRRLKSAQDLITSIPLHSPDPMGLA